MQRAVEAWPDHFSQTGIQLDEVVAISAGRDYIDHTRDQRTTVGDKERARLNLQPRLDSGFGGVVAKQTAQPFTDVAIVNLMLRPQRLDPVTAAEVNNRNGPERLRDVQRVCSNAQPRLRIVPRADVMVNALDLEPILLHERAHIVKILVPDAKAGARAAAGEAVDKACARAGVHANRHLTAGKLLAIGFE